MDNEARPGLFLVPLESGKDWVTEFIVGLRIALNQPGPLSTTHLLLEHDTGKVR